MYTVKFDTKAYSADFPYKHVSNSPPKGEIQRLHLNPNDMTTFVPQNAQIIPFQSSITQDIDRPKRNAMKSLFRRKISLDLVFILKHAKQQCFFIYI